MNAKQLKILIIGGKQAQATGIHAKDGFVEQFARRIERSGKPVFIEYHVPVDLNKVTNVLYYLNIHRYDLILLQMGHSFLQEPLHLSELFAARANQLNIDSGVNIENVVWNNNSQYSLATFKNNLKALFIKSVNSFSRIGRLRDMTHHLSDALHYLQPYSYKVILMTPIPHRDPVSQWLRKQGRKLFLTMGAAYGIPVFDTQKEIRASDEHFLTNNQDQLNTASHELLGSELYDFYQAMIVEHREESGGMIFRRRLPRDN